MPSWWKRTTNYLSSHSNLFVVTGGIIGGAYLVSQYAISKFQQIQEKLVQDKSAKENLRRRFVQNQEDCTFTVLALLPTVGDQLSAKLNVEQLTESLRAHSTGPVRQVESAAPQLEIEPPVTRPPPQTEAVSPSAEEKVEQQSRAAQIVPAQPQASGTEPAEPAINDAPPSAISAKSDFNPLAKTFVPSSSNLQTPIESDQSSSQPIESIVASSLPLSEAAQTEQAQHTDIAAPDTADAATTSAALSNVSATADALGDAKNEALPSTTPGEAVNVSPVRIEVAASSNEKLPATQEPPAFTPPPSQSVPVQQNRERMLLERQAKLRLWNELKIVSFSRTVTSLYCVALLTLQTHIQLNLIGRFAYLASIESQAKPTADDSEHLALQRGTIDASNSVDLDRQTKHSLFALDHETERLYLTYSWWFLHRGWDQVATKVVTAIERTLFALPVKAQISMVEMRALIASARSSIEHELAGDSTKRSNFLEVLFPVTEEQELEALVNSGAVPEDEAPQVLSQNTRLRLLLDETKDIIESSDFASVLQLCLDRVFEVFFNTMAPTFGVQPSTESIGVGPFDTQEFAGARIQEIGEESQNGRSVRLASLFPAVARQSQLAIHGVPNEYIESLADSKELRAFSAIIYSAWPQETI